MTDQRTVLEPSASDAPTPATASEVLAQLGFLVHSDLPDRPGPAFLLVALRERPTLSHYDPETIEYWVTRDGHGRRERLTRASELPIDHRPFSWGEIRILDRLHVGNEYVTFGGDLSAALVDGVAVVVFASDAPLLRRGGHSQGWDEAAENVGAFFGRARLAADYIPGFEARLASLPPEGIYGAFIADLVDRYRTEPRLREAEPQLWSLARGEERRLMGACPDVLRRGRCLVEEMRAA
jgi:hypothetical protein